jgi:tetratricopeptide (TPR) repeat protein
MLLGDFWQGVGKRPALPGLTDLAAAEVLLRAGTLSGWLGSVKQISNAQEAAKALLSESMTRFQALGEHVRAAVAQSELGYCYRREGALDDARALYSEALNRIPDTDERQKGRKVAPSCAWLRSRTPVADLMTPYAS